MGRFTSSKYKNAAAKKLKREDTAFGIRINELCQNDPVACGVDKVVFAGEAASVGVLDVGELGNVQPRSLRGHSQYVRSLEFSPFNKDCLCTCAGDGMVKLWNTDQMTCATTLNVSEHVHMTRFHPVAEHLLLVAEHDDVTLYDVTSQRQVVQVPAPATGVSWSYDGRLVCTSGRTGEVAIRDLRARTEVTKATIFDKNKEVSHEWIGADKLVLSGYQDKDRIFRTVDISNLRSDISAVRLGPGSGAPHSKFDYDTRMLFLYTKGDHGFTYCEVGEGGTININFKEQCSDVIKGMALAPKSLLDVMSGEVNRLLILHHTSLSPTPYVVPRRSYAEFHDDLFPETRGNVPGTDAEGWWNGNDGYRDLVSLNPNSKSSKSNGHKNNTFSVSDKAEADDITAEVPEVKIEENKIHKKVVSNLTEGQSIYRNIEGALSHKNLHYHGLKNVQSVLPQESNGLQTGRKFGVHLMTGSGGRLGVFNLATPGQNNTPQLEIVNGGSPLVFLWDGLEKGQDVLAVGGDCGMVNLWRVDDVTTPATLLATLSGHRNKVIMMSYHPGVPGLLVSGDADGQVILWDTSKYTKVREIPDAGECVALCWDVTNGYLLHVVLKSGTVKTIDWRTNSVKTCELGVELRNARMCCTKIGPVISVLGQRNSRFLFALSRGSDDVTRVLGSHDLSNGTSLYVPAVDPDLNLVFCTARGEASVVPFEVRPTEPFILPLTVHQGQDAQYACSPLPKAASNLMEVELLKMYKLCKDSVQLVTMKLLRLRKEYFQDDIYGHVQLNTADPVLTLQQWVEGGAQYSVPTFDPCPEGVKRVSEVEIVRASSQHAKIQQEHLKYKSHEAQRDELFNSFAEQVQKDAGPLAQELMEGCDEEEWSE